MVLKVTEIMKLDGSQKRKVNWLKSDNKAVVNFM